MSEYTLPIGGSSLIVAWQLKGKHVLVVGGGEVSSGRIKSALASDAVISLVAPKDTLHPLTNFFVQNSQQITHHDRYFSVEDLEGIDMVLSAIDDVEWSKQIYTLCRERRIPVNVADIPSMCDFYFGSQIRNGPLQIMISTNGNGPKMANLIKTRIENTLPSNVGQAIENVGRLRSKLRDRAPGVGGELSRRRMQWMSSLCTTWDLNQLAELDDEEMVDLLETGWEKNVVPQPKKNRRNRDQMKVRWTMSTIALSSAVCFFFGMAMSTTLLRIKGLYR